MTEFTDAARQIVAVGARLDARGLAPATAGNYSIRLDDDSIAITVSGAHKGRLGPDQVMRVSGEGVALDGKKPSAETLLHCLVYAVDAQAGAVLHTHSVAGTVLSKTLAGRDAIELSGYELLKIFPGIDTHETGVAIPLIDNDQDMMRMAGLLRPLLEKQTPLLPAFYIRGHGLYAWGRSMEMAEYLVEACEFLLQCEWEATKRERR